MLCSTDKHNHENKKKKNTKLTKNCRFKYGMVNINN